MSQIILLNTSHSIFVYRRVVIKLFIDHTSAPVEVSVWLGGISPWSDFYVACGCVRGLWEPHAWAAILDDEGLLALAGMLLR